MRYGWRGGWLRIMGPLGANEFDYHDPIATDGLGEVDWTGFWNAIQGELCKAANRYDYLVMPGVRASCTGSSDWFTPKGTAPFCDLSKFGSVENLLASRSRNLRHNLRRTERRLREAGEVKLRVFSANEFKAAMAGLDAFLQAHESRWRHAYRAPGWFESLIREMLPTGLLHLSAIELEDRAISWHFGFVHKKRFYCYVSAFDNSLAVLSPGQVHIHRLIGEAYRLGATVFDFLRGEESYKSEWTEMGIQLFGYESLTPSLGSLSRTKMRDLLHWAARLLRFKPGH
jgi:CelD/BcsL family acetyltransferase involved in cellulose biosynthesis